MMLERIHKAHVLLLELESIRHRITVIGTITNPYLTASYEADLESNHRAFQDIQTEAAVITGVLQEKRINREKIAHAVREIGKIISNQI